MANNRLGNTVDVSPSIEIGNSVYYVSTLFDKHFHAGTDNVKVFKEDGTSKLLKKGEWIGTLFSWNTGKDAKTGATLARLMFFPSQYFGKSYYYLEYTSKDTVSEQILLYNYVVKPASEKYPSWMLLMPGVFLARDVYEKWKAGNTPKPQGGQLPNKQQTDAYESDLDKRDADSKKGMFDDFFKQFDIKQYLPYIYGGAGVLCAVKAFESPSRVVQVGFGGASAGLAYMAYSSYSALQPKPQQ